MNKVLSDTILLVHLAWILFMIAGFIFTVISLFRKEFLDKWLFRTLHLLGIVYVGILAVLKQDCPLTTLENFLRLKYNTSVKEPEFLTYYVEKLVYPDVTPLMIIVPTVFIAVFTATVFIARPPAKILHWAGSLKGRARGIK
ncbi:MAG: DUF2784 family protein [Elusimicrobiota bacterium]